MAVSLPSDPVPARIVLIRHGETPWSVSGRHTGRTDIALDEAGRKVAADLRSRLANEAFARCYSSPLSRALETAALAGVDEPILLDDLMEWDYGDYEGRTTADIHQERPDWDLWRDGCPHGEQAADVAVRADRVISVVVAASTSKDVVGVFGHGHMLRELGTRWLGLDPGAGELFSLDVASVSVLGFEHDKRVLQAWNT